MISSKNQTKGREGRVILHSNILWMGNGDPTLPIFKARVFYKSWMNQNKIENKGTKPKVEYIRLLSIPEFFDKATLNNSNQNVLTFWDFYKSLKFTQQNFFILTAFFYTDVISYYQKNSQRIIKIDDSGFSLQQEIYVSHP
ncbi:hypothetical protein MXB_937, partial [Myxobolus squamalis]